MNRRPSLRLARALAALVLLSLIIDLVLKRPADRHEIMWACYWASITLAVGIFIRSDRLVSAGVIFFLGLGLPVWLLGIIVDSQVEITSVLLHTVPLIAGLNYVSSMTTVPRYSALGAWLLYVVPFSLAWQLCDPRAMINLSHWSRWPLPDLVPHAWQFSLFLLATSAAAVSVVARVMNSFLLRKSALSTQTQDAPSSAHVV